MELWESSLHIYWIYSLHLRTRRFLKWNKSKKDLQSSLMCSFYIYMYMPVFIKGFKKLLFLVVRVGLLQIFTLQAQHKQRGNLNSIRLSLWPNKRWSNMKFIYFHLGGYWGWSFWILIEYRKLVKITRVEFIRMLLQYYLVVILL